MSKYILIESRDPSESADVQHSLDLASALVSRGQEVTIYLVQNAVLRARVSARSEMFEQAIKSGVTLLADDFSLRERGIGPDQIRPGITPSPLETVVDGLAEGAKTIWN
ncbi:MAG: DsrE family protein [Woeseiaceae bacterium]